MDAQQARERLRNARWEIYVDAFIDVLQATTQIVTMAVARSVLWTLLLPHVASNVLAFAAFSSRYSERLARLYELSLAATLSGDALLLLSLSFAFAECVVRGRETYRMQIAFGTDVCAGGGFHLGIVETTLIGLTLGSIVLQARQLVSVSSVLAGGSGRRFHIGVIGGVLFVYSLCFKAFTDMRFSAFFDAVSVVFFLASLVWGLDRRAPGLVVFVGFLLFQVLDALYVFVDHTVLCDRLAERTGSEVFTCMSESVYTPIVVAALNLVRVLLFVLFPAHPAHAKLS